MESILSPVGDRAPAHIITKNLVHLMVGPLFLLNELFRIRPAESPAP
jgi:hypothetical protein